MEKGEGEAEAAEAGWRGRGEGGHHLVLMKTLCILDTALDTSHIYLILHSLCKVAIVIPI